MNGVWVLLSLLGSRTNKRLDSAPLLERGESLIELFEGRIRSECEHVETCGDNVVCEACVVFIEVATGMEDINPIVGEAAHQFFDIFCQIGTAMLITLSRSQGRVDFRCKLA